uniref:DUF4371 domain-containing protein n=1 Tax=Octopus bimaculoides TaxID=37653 RepID=A0A0L8GDP1_OCTBM
MSDSDIITKVKLHRTKCTNIVRNVLASYFDGDLISDIGVRKFSLLLDESNDILIYKLLGIVIIYYSDTQKKVVHTFLSMVSLETCDADGIVDALKIELVKKKLDIKNSLAIGTDNARVMIGVNNGVFQKLKKVPPLLLFRCICHSLQLAVSHTCAECLPINLEFLVSETYKRSSHSSTRQKLLKIMNSCRTRWLSIEPAVNRILSQWFELQTHFQTTTTKEKCFTAQTLHEMFCDSRNELYLLFLHPILKHVQEVNKLFESNNVNKTKLLEDLPNLIKSVANMIVLPTCRIDPLDPDASIEKFLHPKPNSGYRFERKIAEMIIKKTVTATEENNIRKRAQLFLLCLYKELKHHLPGNINILRNIKCFSVENIMQHFKEPILPVLEAMHLNEEKIASIEIQFNSIHLAKWTNTSNTEAFWLEVLEYKDTTGGRMLQILSIIY